MNLTHSFLLQNCTLLFPGQRRMSLERGIVAAHTALDEELVVFLLTLTLLWTRFPSAPVGPTVVSTSCSGKTNETRQTPAHISKGNPVCQVASSRKQSTPHARTQSLPSSQCCACGMSTFVKLCFGLKSAVLRLFREEVRGEGSGRDMKGFALHFCAEQSWPRLRVDISPLAHCRGNDTPFLLSLCVWWFVGTVFAA